MSHAYLPTAPVAPITRALNSCYSETDKGYSLLWEREREKMLLCKQLHKFFWGKLTCWDIPGGDLPHPLQKGKQTVAGDSDQHIARSPGDLCHWISALGRWGSYPESHPVTPQHELLKTVNASLICTPLENIKWHLIELHPSALSCQGLFSVATACSLDIIAYPCQLVPMHLPNYSPKPSI